MWIGFWRLTGWSTRCRLTSRRRRWRRLVPVDDKATQAALDAMVVRVEAAAAGLVTKAALAIQSAAMGSLHTGYGVRTGTMRRSHTVVGPTGAGGVWSARVGPTVIYARRFELGFRGADSLGRVYDQQPRPYFRTAAEQTLPAIRELIVTGFTRAIGG